MKIVKLSFLAIILIVFLGAAGCGRSGVTTVDGLTVATDLDLYNQPANDLDRIAASAEVIYLTARVESPTPDTRVRVRWYRLPSDLIASEDFTGQRDSSNRFDFSKAAASSFFASRINREGLTWPLGDYEAQVWLGSERVATKRFKVVSDADADQDKLASYLDRLATGNTLNNQFLLANNLANFSRDESHIYIQASLDVPKDTATFAVEVRQVREDNVFAKFTEEVSGEKDVVFDLDRNEFGKLWSDRLWPAGALEISALINNVEVESRTIFVEE